MTFEEWFLAYYRKHGFITSKDEALKIWNAATEAENNRVCVWTRAAPNGHFYAQCPTGLKAAIIPSENWDFPYCPYCGGKIEVTE